MEYYPIGGLGSFLRYLQHQSVDLLRIFLSLFKHGAHGATANPQEMGQSPTLISGMLKKAASGVLVFLPCSRTESTLRASKRLRPCWTDPRLRRGHAFLTIPLAADVDHSLGIYRLWEVKYSTSPSYDSQKLFIPFRYLISGFVPLKHFSSIFPPLSY